MKKIYSLLLTATMLLIGGNAWAVTRPANDAASLNDAITAAETGDIVQLTADVDLGATTLQIDKAGVEFTLDLNGHNLTGSNVSYNTGGIIRMQHGTLTVKTSQTGGSIGVLGESQYVLNVSSNGGTELHDGTVILESGTIYGKNYVINLSAGTGTFIMNGGEVIADGSSASTAVTVNAVNHAMETCSAIINGGKIYAKSKAAARGVATTAAGGVVINGGSITGETTNSNSYVYSVCGGTSYFVSIRGGYFNAIGGKSAQTTDLSYVKNITGGKFAKTPSLTYLDEGYTTRTISETIDGVTYTTEVVPTGDKYFAIGGTQYVGLQDAIDAANNGDVIKLIKSTSNAVQKEYFFPAGKSLTLDLNGLTLDRTGLTSGSISATSTDHSAFNVCGNLTIKDLVGTGVIKCPTPGGIVVKGGALTLESGKIEADVTSGYARSIMLYSGSFTMNDGELFAKISGSASTCYALQIAAGATATINGGKIYAESQIDHKAIDAIMCAGIVTVNDVEMCIRNTGTSTNTLAFVGNSNGTQVINGGKFVVDGNTTSSDGLFTKNTKIFGGLFNRDVQTWVPLGEPYMCEAKAGLGTCYGLALTHKVVVNPAPVAYIRNVTQSKDYTSISTAFAEATNNDELCALQDMDFAQASLTIDKSITFDINGHNLTANSAVLYLIGGVDEDHTLVLTDKAAIKGLISGSSPIQLKGGYVSLDGIKVSGTSLCFNESSKGNYTLQNVVANVVANATTSKVYYLTGSSKTVVNNCQFTLDATNVPSKTTSSSFVSVFSMSTSGSTLAINGGQYRILNTTSTNTPYAGVFCGKTSSNTISIYDGYFSVEGAATTKYISTATSTTYSKYVKIYGGKYNLDPRTWLVDGFVLDPDLSEGIYTYGVVESNIASVNGTEYKTISEAINAAKLASAPVELLHSTVLTSTLDLPAGVTFAATSYTLELAANTPIRLEDGATVPACVTNTNFVASIPVNNATYYFYSLDKAVSACGSTQTVKLLQDVEDGAKITISSGTKTIDFNGHNYSSSKDMVFYVSAYIAGSTTVNLINNSATESIVECTNAELQSDCLYATGGSGAVNVTVGNGVTIKGSYGASVWKNATLNVYGKVVGKRVFAICGNGSTGNGGTTINIYDGAEVESQSTALYHPQVGTLNIYGGEFSSDLSCIEFRGGEANISGGHFYCSKAYADNDDHSGGSSTEGCGFGINPYYDVTVNITGGVFEAYCPFYQAQATGKDKTITIAISDGYFKAINNSKKTIWAETTNKFITGGYYNFTPAAYVADNKAVVPNDDPVYKFAIADVVSAVTFTTAGQWSADGNWSAEATTATPVVIAADCEIANGVIANVYGLTLNSGKTLTVKKGGKLIVGAEGLVNNAGAANLIIEDGAYVAINPVATNATFAATVHHASQTRALTPAEQAASAHGYDKLWEVCANPIGNAALTFPVGLDVRASRWSNGWVGVNSLSEIATPFGAYMMATNAATSGTDIRWTGTTNGVANQSIAASNTGWYFIGNSYLAPIDIVEFIDNLGANVEKQIYMYKASTETFQPITRTTAGTGSRFDALNSVVEPKSGFFVRATGKATVGLDYTQSVWDALNAKVAAAPGRHKITTPRSEINHTAKMEFAVQSLDDATRYSVLDIFEAAAYTTSKQDDYDFTAFINQSPNINFVAEQYGIQLNTVSLPNLDSLTLAFNSGASTNLRIYFDKVEGATYYLYDAVTDTYTEIADGTYYDFSVATATGDVMVSDRFMIVADSHLNPTGIEGVGEQSVFVKYIENGNLYIKSNGRVINAHGQVVK